MTSDILDLAEFEREFAAGKFDHLVANIKKGKPQNVVPIDKKKLEKQNKAKQSAKLLEQKLTITKPVEIPKPAAIQKNFLVLTCKCCENTQILLQSTRIRLDYKKDGSVTQKSHFIDYDEKMLKDLKESLPEVPQHTPLMVEFCNYCLGNTNECSS